MRLLLAGSQTGRCLLMLFFVALVRHTTFSQANNISDAKIGELQERKVIMAEVKAAFQAEDFEKIDDLATRYRQGRERTSSGLWKLSLLDVGISSAMQPGRNEASESYWREMEKKISRWVEKFPESPSAHLALSKAFIGRAWFYRGNGYASTVPEQAWKPFHIFIDKAFEELQENKKIVSVDPRWYERMLTVARAKNWPRETVEELLDEACSKEPLFYQTYFLAIEFLLPKWNGSVVEIENFADKAVEMTKDVEGMGMYARIYWFASQTQFKENLFKGSLVVWPKMKSGFDDVMKRYPDAWNLNNYAHFACLAGDKEKARELINKIGDTPIAEAWESRDTYDKYRQWVAAD